MRGLLEFRTKCVRQFVEHMKKWLSNWELKQEFLSNLRKEFAADAALLLQAIDRVAERGTEGVEVIR